MASEKARVPRYSEVQSTLRSIDWSFSSPFSQARSKPWLFDARKHHWYPATFVPEIPYTLIEMLSEPGARVYDPFMGIGTSIYQALLLGRIPIGTEISLVPVELARSICTLLDPEAQLHFAKSVLHRIRREFDPDKDYRKQPVRHCANFEALEPWYSDEVMNELYYLAELEASLEDPVSQAATKLVMSSILKAVSAQDRGWGCISDNVLPKEEQLKKKKHAVDQFIRGITILTKDVNEIRNLLPPISRDFLRNIKADDFILRQDVRDQTVLPDCSVDLIVTSPPYANMTDYSLSQRLSYYWFGEHPKTDLGAEIGARRKRGRRDSVTTYTSEMIGAMKNIAQCLNIDGYVCLVMPVFSGDSRNNTERRQATDEFIASLISAGLVKEDMVSRILPSRRRHHNQKWTSLTKENIFIFRRRE